MHTSPRLFSLNPIPNPQTLICCAGMRLRLIRLIPRSIMLATSAGIGLFLAFIGLQNTEGMAVVSYDGYTLVSLGGCPAQYQVPPAQKYLGRCRLQACL